MDVSGADSMQAAIMPSRRVVQFREEFSMLRYVILSIPLIASANATALLIIMYVLLAQKDLSSARSLLKVS